jgi:hemerythrin-like domain-containing protein
MRRDPFEMLERCHRRLEDTLATLAQPTRQALDEALEFIDHSVRRHEEDEERSLFPRLARVRTLAPLLDRLTVQHRDQSAAVEELRALLAAAVLDERRLREVAARLRAAYAEHIALEERELFPAARNALTEEDVSAIAAEMDARRGR